MFGRRFKAEYRSKKYVGMEEGTNIAVDIVMPPEYNVMAQLLFNSFGYVLIANLFLDNDILIAECLVIGIVLSLYIMSEPEENKRR